MSLELARDECLLRSDEMEDLDDVAIARHGAARGKDDGQHRGSEHDAEHDQSDDDRRAGHGDQSVDPFAMIVEACARNLGRQSLVDRGESREATHGRY